MPPKNKRRRWWLAAVAAVLIVTPLVWVFFNPEWVETQVTKYVAERRQETHELRLKDPGAWRTLADGLELRWLDFGRQGRWLAGFHLVALRVDPLLWDLRMLQVPPEELPAVDMEILAEQNRAVALINASFFDPEMKVMGLLIIDGQTVSPLRPEGSIHHGVFFLRDRRAYLVHRTSVDLAGVSQAFQAGPWLVTDGEAQSHFRNAQVVSRRTAISVDRRGRVILSATDDLLGGLSLPELAKVLADPEPRGLGVWRAINCDGGTSTQMVLNYPDASFAIRSTVNVPIYLGVFAK